MRFFAIIFYLMMIVIISVGQKRSTITIHEEETEQTTISSKTFFLGADSLGLVQLTENKIPTNNLIINF